MQSSFLMVSLFYLSSWTEVMMDSFSDVRRRLLLHQEEARRPLHTDSHSVWRTERGGTHDVVTALFAESHNQKSQPVLSEPTG